VSVAVVDESVFVVLDAVSDVDVSDPVVDVYVMVVFVVDTVVVDSDLDVDVSVTEEDVSVFDVVE
jgi:hypothetical protein